MRTKLTHRQTVSTPLSKNHFIFGLFKLSQPLRQSRKSYDTKFVITEPP